MAKNELYRLPGGEYTPSVKKYLSAWKELTEPFEKIGLHCYGFDPGLAFVTVTDGQWVNGSSFELPVYAALKIGKALRGDVLAG